MPRKPKAAKAATEILAPIPAEILAQIVRDCISQDPKPSASVLQGLFFGRIAPPPFIPARRIKPMSTQERPARPSHAKADNSPPRLKLANRLTLKRSARRN